MLDIFLFAMNAIFPIVILIGLGYFLKYIQIIDQHFVMIMNKYIFRVGLPIFLFYNVYKIESFNDIKWEVIIFSSLVLIVVFILGIFIANYSTKDERQKGVLLQSFYRSNFALLGIPLVEILGSSEALASVAILAAFSIPIANILSVISLTMFRKNDLGEKISIRVMLKTIISNPLIVAVLLGMSVLALRTLIPTENGELVVSLKKDMPFMISAMKLITQATTPMALIALGGQFQLSVIKPLLKKITLGVTIRILIVPFFVYYLVYLLQDRYTALLAALPALIGLFGTPVAISSLAMTAEMDGDEQLAGQLVIWSTVFSIFTIFITIVILKSAGML
jgi:malate permease and related proteins